MMCSFYILEMLAGHRFSGRTFREDLDKPGLFAEVAQNIPQVNWISTSRDLLNTSLTKRAA